MILTDLHMHTNYCDGADTPEEMVLSAIALGMDCIGFSAHSYTFFDESYCMKKEKSADYRREIAALKEKYKETIRILCGIEQDYYSAEPVSAYDYVIGSVHYLKMDSVYIPVDESKDILLDAVEKYFHGDIYALVNEYFSTIKNVVTQTNADIIGHFDLISKFNEDGSLFDENDSRYIKAWQEALDELLSFDIPFEINTGAISRSYRTFPYPNADMIQYIKNRHGTLILSSDSHSKHTLCYDFTKYESLITN